MKQTLELFSGTRSFSKIAEERGYSTFCVELNNAQKADLHSDILKVTTRNIPRKIDIQDISFYAETTQTTHLVLSIWRL